MPASQARRVPASRGSSRRTPAALHRRGISWPPAASLALPTITPRSLTPVAAPAGQQGDGGVAHSVAEGPGPIGGADGADHEAGPVDGRDPAGDGARGHRYGEHLGPGPVHGTGRVDAHGQPRRSGRDGADLGAAHPGARVRIVRSGQGLQDLDGRGAVRGGSPGAASAGVAVASAARRLPVAARPVRIVLVAMDPPRPATNEGRAGPSSPRRYEEEQVRSGHEDVRPERSCSSPSACGRHPLPRL